MKILTTGGAGYIGSHTCLELLQAGHEVVAVDNLCNSKEESLKRVQEIAGRICWTGRPWPRCFAVKKSKRSSISRG
jgi:UDP-glucose 4-epimerase